MRPEPKRRLLIVDDEVGICDSLQLILEFAGYDVRCAYTTAEALNLMRTDSFDGVLTDLRLPDGDGFEVLRAARASVHSANAIPPAVIVMTGFSDFSASEILSGGAADFLLKPFDVNLLIAKLDSRIPAPSGTAPRSNYPRMEER